MESLNNDLVYGSSGRIGEMLVFRQRGNRTFISKRPRKSDVPYSPKQIAVKERFREGVLYAKSVLADPAKKAMYEAKTTGNQTAYNLALSDYCKSPEIKNVNYSAYQGQDGNNITIRATDDFKVDKVSVSIKDSNDNELENGLAVLSANGIDWIYTAKTVNASPAGCTLIVEASDIPGNVTTEEFVF